MISFSNIKAETLDSGTPDRSVHVSYYIIRLHNLTAGWSARRLHRVGFVPPDSPGAFEFIDPFDIIRGVHMIPAFSHGIIDELGKSVARRPADDDEDWEYYYVGM